MSFITVAFSAALIHPFFMENFNEISYHTKKADTHGIHSINISKDPELSPKSLLNLYKPESHICAEVRADTLLAVFNLFNIPQHNGRVKFFYFIFSKYRLKIPPIPLPQQRSQYQVNEKHPDRQHITGTAASEQTTLRLIRQNLVFFSSAPFLSARCNASTITTSKTAIPRLPPVRTSTSVTYVISPITHIPIT